MSQQPERFEGASANITDEQKAKLKSLFPEIVTEGGKIDFDRLKLTLGESVDVGKERYGMNWPGKADCFKTIQRPSMATLVPARDESVNFDMTENLIIEGDNLETLKLLQKAYLGKVKMIYIDPPYNTGGDFIYPDDYTEDIETYLRYTGQIDNEGKKFSTNTEVDGRFHSKWMSMMYPRLFLARNLMREDGIVMSSISDDELGNLIALFNEVFGEENHLGTFIWLNEGNIDNQSRIKVNHEYIVVYARNELFVPAPAVIDPNISSESKLYREFIENTIVKNGPANPVSEILLPKGFPANFDQGTIKPKENFWPHLNGAVVIRSGVTQNAVGVSSGWSSKEIFDDFIKGGFKPVKDIKGQETVFYLTETGAVYCRKKRLDSQSHVLTVLRGMGTVQAASSKLAENGIDFSYPKPIELLQYLIQVGSGKDGIIMDFFAGSGTTAEAVLNLNEKGSHRKFILVQLPEQVAVGGFKTIADLCKERVRRILKKISKTEESRLALEENKPDLGFKVFKLKSSNFKAWNTEQPKDDVELVKQLTLHVNHLVAGRTQEDVLYELLLKSGFPLDTKVEKFTLASKTIFSVADGIMLICLEKELTPEVINAMAEKKPERVVCLDAGFADNDQLKTNAVQTMKSKGVTKFQTV
jgi:adenine-specific DNA-methyltransferase